MENIQRFLLKAKHLADRLNLAIEHQNSLTQGGFDVTGMGFSKTLEDLEKRLTASVQKFESMQEKVVEAKHKVTVLTEELEAISEDNSSLAKSENALISHAKPLRNEHHEIAQELQKKLKMYKVLTGVRFNFESSDDMLNGYIAISDNEPSKCTLVPFKIDKNNFNSNQQLWKKMNEAYTEVIEYK